MASIVNLKSRGLYTAPNQLSVDEGAMNIASNVIIRQEGITEPRRGFKVYGNSFGDSTTRAKQLFTYKNRIIRHYSDTLQFDDGVGNFTSFSGSFEEAVPNIRIKKFESNGNCYITTSEGVKRISALSTSELSSAPGYIQNAGVVQAIDLTASLNLEQGNTSSFLPADSTVAYEVVWGMTDANGNQHLGTPSQRVDVSFSLKDAVILDLITLANNLDLITAGLITDSDYSSSVRNDLNGMNAAVNASAVNVNSAMVNLCSKLDNDIEYTEGALNTVSTQRLTTTTVDIVFSAPVTSVFQNDDLIICSNFVVAGTTDVNAKPLRVTNIAGSTISCVIASSAVFAATDGAPVADVAGEVNSNNYRSIVGPTDIVDPANADMLISLQTYLSAILNRLRIELNNTIPTAERIALFDSLSLTTTASVSLEITIPNEIDETFFYQVYRTSYVQALQTAVLDDLIAGSEFQLVFEAYPTLAELATREIKLVDDTPEAFKGAFLYTNPANGEGILQSNDLPPFCQDMNIFKGYAFYANTRTRYNQFISLLGVQKMIDDALIAITPEVMITDSSNTSTYEFILGVNEKTDLTVSSIVLDGQYVLLYSAYDNKVYKFWFYVAAVEPVVADTISVKVDITGLTTTAAVASRLNDTINSVVSDFTSTLLGSVVTVTNRDSGQATNASSSTVNLTVSVVTQGVGEKVEYHKDNITFNVLPTPGQYFNLYTAGNRFVYYPWYKVNGIGSDPLAFGTGIQVDILSTDTMTDVATKTKDAINEIFYFVATSAGPILTVEDYEGGFANTATVGTLGVSITITNVVVGILQVVLSQNISPAKATDETARSFVRIVNKNRGSNVTAFYISGAQQVPGQMFFQSKTLDQIQFTLLANNANTGSSFNPDIASKKSITAISVGSQTTVTSTAHALQDGQQVVIMNSDSVPSIDGVYTIFNSTANTFQIDKAVTTAGTSGVYSKFTDSVSATNEAKTNRVYYSKFQQPEAVPITNYLDIGGTGDAILRIFPLRDSLFVFKEDGLYRISGEIAPFTVALFDSSCKLIAADSVNVSNNLVYAWTRQGIAAVSESGITVVSRPIEFDLFALNTPEYVNFRTATWGIGYESDNSYTVYTIQTVEDVVATIGYRYSTLTNSWTTIDKTVTCGVIPTDQDKLYLGCGDINNIEVERKAFDRTDYADREYTKVISSGRVESNGLVIGFSTLNDFGVGDVIEQSTYVNPYLFNALLLKLDIDPGVTDTNYFSTLKASAGSDMRQKLVALATKLDADAGVADTDFLSTIDFKSGTITSMTTGNPGVITSTAHGLFTGRMVTIAGNTSIVSPNGTSSVTVLSANTFTVPSNITTAVGDGSFVTDINSIYDIQACYNKVIAKLNADVGIAFSNYQSITSLTKIEAIVTSLNYVTKKATLNIALEFTVGDVTLYKAILSKIRFSPITMGNPLSLKHISETTLLFQNKTFTKGMLSFSTDLLPEAIPVNVLGQGNGIFGIGTGNFGQGFFGGNSHSAPFRTYVPRQCQRCTYLVLEFAHGIAREKFVLYGATVTANENSESTRGYR